MAYFEMNSATLNSRATRMKKIPNSIWKTNKQYITIHPKSDTDTQPKEGSKPNKGKIYFQSLLLGG